MCTFLSDTSISVSSQSLVMIAVERFLAFLHPFKALLITVRFKGDWEASKQGILNEVTHIGYLTLAAFHSVETATFLSLIKRLPCEGIQDSLGFWILCHGFRFSGIWFRICCHRNLYSGFQILPVQICWDSGFHKQNFHGFWIPLQGATRERLSKSERFSKPFLYSEPLDISRTATPAA